MCCVLLVLYLSARGILSLAWCQRDSHLLLSAGKDDKILCWDPHSDAPGGEVVSVLSVVCPISLDTSRGLGEGELDDDELGTSGSSAGRLSSNGKDML